MPLIPVLKRLRQGTCHVFEASLDLQGKIIFGIQLYQANLGYRKTLGKGKKGLAPVLSQEGDLD